MWWIKLKAWLKTVYDFWFSDMTAELELANLEALQVYDEYVESIVKWRLYISVTYWRISSFTPWEIYEQVKRYATEADKYKVYESIHSHMLIAKDVQGCEYYEFKRETIDGSPHVPIYRLIGKAAPHENRMHRMLPA